MPNSLKGSEFIYNNPQARAEDLMTAFKDTRVKAIIANIGGEDSIRLLPYIDFNAIRENPKILWDTLMLPSHIYFAIKQVFSSFYLPSNFDRLCREYRDGSIYGRNGKSNSLFNEMIGEIQAAHKWTSERLEWIEINKDTRRKMQQNNGYELLQGSTTVQGRLIGGCIEY